MPPRFWEQRVARPFFRRGFEQAARGGRLRPALQGVAAHPSTGFFKEAGELGHVPLDEAEGGLDDGGFGGHRRGKAMFPAEF